ncbi:hypothetical protein [Rhodopirellula sallentina]|uniref:hypothetical protein n=1 Tax=Rhodopirellula sallentina TaxID=1263869 RepID=UPI0005C7C20E|nr:hypothetical protein [Rhodopirellula sallentina]
MKPTLKVLLTTVSVALVALCGTTHAQTTVAHQSSVSAMPVGAGCVSGNCGGSVTVAQPVQSYTVPTSVPQTSTVQYSTYMPAVQSPPHHYAAPQWQSSCSQGTCGQTSYSHSYSRSRSRCGSCRRGR